MKNKIKTIIVGIVCFAFGLSFVIVSYANSYSSSEITYDTSTSGAVQNNVKDALDFLYNKTKSGASSECPENMSCVEKPRVTLNVSGPGKVNKGTVYVGIGETNTFTVTPNNNKALRSISCTNGYTLSSFKTVDIYGTQAAAAQTITIKNPNTSNGSVCTITFGDAFMCRRATILHTTTCNSPNLNSGCQKAGIAIGTTLTFGSLGTKGTLKSGDAFDCDVNRDGTFNATNERFYYITNLASDSNKAVLLYYSNTSGGVATPSKVLAYHSGDVSNAGPVTAREDLPSTSQWVTRITNPRQIINDKGENIVSYNYGDRASRLLTYQEINTACGGTSSFNTKCPYTMENTYYDNASTAYGYWLETTYHFGTSALVVSGHHMASSTNTVSRADLYGARPAIEVPKSEISY